MTPVVGLAIIIRDPLQGIVRGDVFRVLLHEFLDRIPQRGDGFDILVQTDHEAVLFAVVGHPLESVVLDVAEEFDAWLDAPVPLVLKHQRMLEKEARLIATHVSIADGVAVDDLTSTHVFTCFLSLRLVDEVGE